MTNKAYAGELLPEMELTEADIPGATLDEPLESSTVKSLRWWLLCHGIQVSTSLKKDKMIERLVGLASSESISILTD